MSFNMSEIEHCAGMTSHRGQQLPNFNFKMIQQDSSERSMRGRGGGGGVLFRCELVRGYVTGSFLTPWVKKKLRPLTLDLPGVLAAGDSLQRHRGVVKVTIRVQDLHVLITKYFLRKDLD